LLLFISSLVALGICFVLPRFVVWVAGLCPSLPSPHPLKPSLSLRRTSQPKALLHLIGGGSAETPTAQPTLRHSYTTLGSAVGTPLGRAHRVVLPSPPTQPPPTLVGALPLSGPSVQGRPHRLGGGRRRGKGGFEGLQGVLRAWAAERF
jgi:hypothetical protein